MTRFRTGWVAVLLALAAAGVILTYWTPVENPSGTWHLVIDSNSGTHRFAVELAHTPEEHLRGLMFRENLADDAGMLFIHDHPGVRNMWMKDTPLSLDMLFLDPEGTIRHIVHDTVPLSLSAIISPDNTQYVLELRAGVARKLGIRAGDQVRGLPSHDQSSASSSQ